MKRIIEELYCGNIRPDSRCYGPESPFAEAARLKRQSHEKLMERLNASEKELFEEYCDAQGEMESITRYDTFTYALISSLSMNISVISKIPNLKA